MSDLPLKEALSAHGAGAEDLAWFDSFGWDPAGIPAATPRDMAAYQSREALLNKTLGGLTFAERGNSEAGRLAAAIGARIADLKDEVDDDAEAP